MAALNRWLFFRQLFELQLQPRPSLRHLRSLPSRRSLPVPFTQKELENELLHELKNEPETHDLSSWKPFASVVSETDLPAPPRRSKEYYHWVRRQASLRKYEYVVRPKFQIQELAPPVKQRSLADAVMHPDMSGWQRSVDTLFDLMYPKGFFEKIKIFERERLGVNFNSKMVLIRSFVHVSAIEHGKRDQFELSNTRMQMIGDSLLDVVLNGVIMERYPHDSVGTWIEHRNILRTNYYLYKLAVEFRLHDLMIVSDSVPITPMMMADTMEAVIAAVYQDQGLASAISFVTREMVPRLFHFYSNGRPPNKLEEMLMPIDLISLKKEK